MLEEALEQLSPILMQERVTHYMRIPDHTVVEENGQETDISVTPEYHI